MRPASFALAWSLALLAPAAASAQARCTVERDRIEDASNRLEAGDHEGAERGLRLALGRCPDDPQVQGMLGFAEVGAQHFVEAERHLQGALAYLAMHRNDRGGRDERDLYEWVRENRAQLESDLAAARGWLGSLTVTANVPDAVLTLPDERRVVLPMGEPARVHAGTFSVRVTAPGYAAATREVELAPGAAARVALRLEPEAPPPAPAPAVQVRREVLRQVRHPSPWRTAGWITVGTGVASAVASAVLWGVSFEQQRHAREATVSDPEYGAWARTALATPGGDPDAMCARARDPAALEPRPGDAARVRDLCASNATTQGLAWGLAGLGAALVGGGLAMVLTAHDRVEERRELPRVSAMLGAAERGVIVTVPF